MLWIQNCTTFLFLHIIILLRWQLLYKDFCVFMTSRFKLVEITSASTIAVASRSDLIEVDTGISVSFNCWHKIIVRASIKVAGCDRSSWFCLSDNTFVAAFILWKSLSEVSRRFKWHSAPSEKPCTTCTTDFSIRLSIAQCIWANLFFNCVSANITHFKNFYKTVGKPWISFSIRYILLQIIILLSKIT